MNILLIDNDESFAKNLESKLVFLRSDDSIVIASYAEACYKLKLSNSTVIIVHENLDASLTLELLKDLRQNSELCIILLLDSKNPELILAASDIGVDDFAYCNDENYELVIKIVNNIKHNSVKLAAARNLKLLEQLKAVDEFSGLYSNDFCKQVIENIIDTNLINSGVFMALSPSKDAKVNFSTDKMSKALKLSVRAEDIAALGRGVNFYIFMPRTSLNGAVVVLNKIKENLDFDIAAGISEITGKSYEEFEQGALKALASACATGADFVFAEETVNTIDEWLEESESKNYKLFRKVFNKKLEKIITPVFYMLQQTYEDKLLDTKIVQFINNDQCVFKLKSKKGESSLRIIYPGFAKIIIYIEHEGLDGPENREIHLQLNRVTEKELVKLVEDFIKEYKER